MKWLDLGYNLVKSHDGSSAFLVVDHDEEEMIAARAPIGNVYAPGGRRSVACTCLLLCVPHLLQSSWTQGVLHTICGGYLKWRHLSAGK